MFMFNLPIEQIDFATVQSFCSLRLKERLDLDYKREWPSDLDKILCAMANVQGGMVLIGIDEEGDTRQPAWPPIGVPGTDDGLHQRVIQIAYDAVYPPLIPEVAICRLPSEPTRAIVVIRVEASNLLHAVDGRKKIYVRVADHSRGYELAQLTDIEWLWDKRARSVAFRENLIARARARAMRASKSGPPTLVTWIVPTFPTLLPVQLPPDLLRMANEIGIVRSQWPQVARSIPYSAENWRTVAGGVSVTSKHEGGSGIVPYTQYLELGSNGLIYFQQVLDTDSKGAGPLLHTYKVMAYVDLLFEYASRFFERIAWFGPVLCVAQLHNAGNNTELILDKQMEYTDAYHMCSDDVVDLIDIELLARELSNNCETYLVKAASHLAWAYGYNHDTLQIQMILSKMAGR